MGILSNAGAWLAGQMQTAAGVSVTYTRKVGGAISLTAWVGRSVFLHDTTAPRYVQWGARDYLVEADELAVSGTRVTPEIGDRITETIEGVACVYEVCADEAGEHWRWADQNSRKMVRLHAKRVS